MIRLLALLLVLFASPAWAMEHYVNVVQDKHGEALRSVTVSVYAAGTTNLSTIYSDNGTTTKTNPMTTSSDGIYDFYASNGAYDITFARSGYTFDAAQTRRITLFDVADFSGGGGGGGGSSAFSSITSGTNTTAAAMIIGTGASMTYSGSGSINASLFKGNATVLTADGGTGQTSATDDALLLGNGSGWITTVVPSCSDATGNHLNYVSATNTFVCGTSAASVNFSSLTSGTNTTATMTIGTGSTFTFSGSGNVNANQFKGNSTVAVVDGGTGITAVAANQVALGTAANVYTATTLPSCSNAATSKVLYDNATHTFSCGTDQTGAGGIVSAVAPNVTVVNAGNSPYTALTTDWVLRCDTTLASRAITLPAATNLLLLNITNVGSNSCTITRAGADTISGSTTLVLQAAGVSTVLASDGVSTWDLY